MLNPRIEEIEKATQRLSDFLYLLQNKPTEHIEAVWREKVVLELEDICSMARNVDSIIFGRRNSELQAKTKKMCELWKDFPQNLKNFVEGR